jgi:predicted Zn-dependent protease
MRLLLLLALAVLAGCALAPSEQPAPVAPPPANAAVAGLVQTARADADAGRLSSAAATLERALRIAPRDARLWHELARVRLAQGEYAQAESLAARSDYWAGADDALRADNWRLIADARRARGDDAGTQAALDEAARFSGSR